MSIVEVAESWIGTPYRKAGLERSRGVDCLNFVGLVAKECGFLPEMPPWRDYPYGFWIYPGDPIRAALHEFGGQWLVSAGELLPGDIVALTHLPQLQKVTHVAIVASTKPHLEVIHARIRSKVQRTRWLKHWRLLEVYRPCR